MNRLGGGYGCGLIIMQKPPRRNLLYNFAIRNPPLRLSLPPENLKDNYAST